MPKIKEITISRGRKYTENYQSINYQASITIIADRDDGVKEVKEMALSELIMIELHEQDHCRDIIGAEAELKEIKQTEDTTPPKEITTTEIKKQPKNTKKVPANGKYKVASKRCNKCQGFITWDDWSQGSLPIHVDVDGIIAGNGACPKGD